MAVTGVYGDTGVAGGGASGTITLTLAEPLPPNLQLTGNPTLAMTPPTNLPATSNRIANVAYVRDAISTYGGGAGPDGNSLPLAGGVLTDLAAGGTGLRLLTNRSEVVTSNVPPNEYNGAPALTINVGWTLQNTYTPHASGRGIFVDNNGWIGIHVDNYGRGVGESWFNPNGIYVRNAIATGINIHHHQGSGLFVHDHYGFGVHVFHYYNAVHGGVYVRNYSANAAIVGYNYAESGGPHGPCLAAWNSGIGPGAIGLGISMHASYGQERAIVVWESNERVFVVGVDGALTLSPAGIASLKAQLGIM